MPRNKRIIIGSLIESIKRLRKLKEIMLDSDQAICYLLYTMYNEGDINAKDILEITSIKYKFDISTLTFQVVIVWLLEEGYVKAYKKHFITERIVNGKVKIIYKGRDRIMYQLNYEKFPNLDELLIEHIEYWKAFYPKYIRK